ncbi:hypothetical protein LR002_02205 [Candidatus Gracilibacteria bacterium]|nr:hypothetical protein [Candidatus Gracilibacteria bacterium]
MFIFEKYSFDKNTKIAKFFYKIEKKSINEKNQIDKKIYDFVEELDFSKINFSKKFLDGSKESEKLLNNLLFFLHLILGSSYYKLTCEKGIKIKSGTLKKSQSHFFERLYKKGLGEFFYENQIDFRGLVSLPYNKFTDFKKVERNYKKDEVNCDTRKDKILVPFGGGKDSSVLIALLEEEGLDFELFTLGDYKICNDVAEKFGKKIISVKRKLSPNLIELNKSEKFLNGHVPISSIYGAVALFVAAAGDFNYIALANENSANEPNIKWNGMEINHQWTKSIEFEDRFSEFIENNITNIKYFSFLRPFNEEKITELFLEKCEKIFDVFSSCNKNFVQEKNLFNQEKDEKNIDKIKKIADEENKKTKYNGPKLVKGEKKIKEKKWCCNCPKCAFVFVMFASKMGIEKTEKILGKNLFLDKNLEKTFLELAGFGEKKPFECVGTFNEVQDAFREILKNLSADEKKNISGDGKNFLNKIKNFLEDENNEKILGKGEKIFGENLVPEKFLKILKKNF